MADLPELSREVLEGMDHDDLIILAKKFKEHELATKYAKGDIYLENAHPGQIEFHKATNRVRIFLGGNRCLAEGTLVATPNGPTKIENLMVGSIVHDERGRPIRVQKFWSNGTREVADITCGGEVLASCTAEHMWLASRTPHIEMRAADFDGESTWIVRDFGLVRVGWGANRRQVRTYDISVGGNNLYFLANGLVTHNSGKTTGGTNEARWMSEGTHPYRSVPTFPNKGCIVVQDFSTHAKDIINKKIEEWFPPGLIVKTDTNQAGAIVFYELRTGSTIDVKSHEQDLKVFEGSDYDWVWFDEPPPQAIFKAVWRGLTDRRGIAWITATPITEPWVFDLYQKATAGQNAGIYWAKFVSIHDNVKNIGGGDVEEGKIRIAEFLDALDPDEREAREKGHFLHMRGLIFKSWSRKDHLIDAFKWPAKWPVMISLDPHPRKPWALSFLGLSPGGYRFLLASYKIDGVVEDVAEFVLNAKNEIELDGQGSPRIHSCWIDNYASVESMVKRNTTIIEELNRLVGSAIPRFKPAPKNVDEKINIFKSWLKVRDSKYGPRPGFMVFDVPENRDFIYEIEHYVWASQRGVRRQLLKNTPEKENDDILDTIMQLALVLDSKKRQDLKEDQPKVHNYIGR